MRKVNWLVLGLVILEFLWLWQTKKLGEIVSLFRNKNFSTEIRDMSEMVVKKNDENKKQNEEIEIQQIVTKSPIQTTSTPTKKIVKI